MNPAPEEAVAVGSAAQRVFLGGRRAHDFQDRLRHDEGDRGVAKAADPAVSREAPAGHRTKKGGGEAPSARITHAAWSPARRRPAPRRWRYISTIVLNPPKAMRLTSKSIGSFISFAMRGSFMTFAFTLSRCLRDL